MSRIVMTTIGSLGDLYPMIAIAKELQQRQHSLVFATHARYQDLLESLGFEFCAVRPDLNPDDDPTVAAQLMDVKTGTQAVTQFLMDHLSETYVDLEACSKGAALVIAGEGAYCARLVSEKLGIPWVSVVLQPAAFLSPYDMPVLPVLPWFAKLRRLGPTFNSSVVQLAKVVARNWVQPLIELREDLDLSPLQGHPFIDDKYSDDLVLAMFSSVFAQAQPDWPVHTVQAGFPFYDGHSGDASEPALAAELQEFLAAGDSPIVFTLGSAAVAAPGDFYIESIRAAKQLNRRAVLLMGDNPLPERLPASVFAADYVPHSLIFSKACAVVHQGGIGTTAQALRAGKPTLIVPYSHDQPDNADRVARLGTSVVVKRDRYQVKTVVKALEELLGDARYTRQAEAVRDKIRDEDGARTASEAVEKLLKKR